MKRIDWQFEWQMFVEVVRYDRYLRFLLIAVPVVFAAIGIGSLLGWLPVV